MERRPGIAGRLQRSSPRIRMRQPELELVHARDRLTDRVVLPFELVSETGCADEVSTISVEAVANHQVHRASERSMRSPGSP